IPTNRPLIRVENPDTVYRTEREKFEAVVAEIKEFHESGRPVLVGTISIEKSEHLSTLLKKAGIKHVVLNAKYHEREAEIFAQAQAEMARDYKKTLVDKKPSAEERRTLGKRYVGLLASFAPDHPSVLSTEALAQDIPALRTFLETAAALPRSLKAKIAHNFYPQGEKPVDFLEVHPMRADIERIAADPGFAKIEEFLDASERE